MVNSTNPSNAPDVALLLDATPETPASSSQPDSSSVQQQVLDNLKLKRGILSGRDLYRQYGESNKDVLKSAIRALEQRNLVSVKGSLESPLGVFQSVLVQR
jgi:hypothetical protein